jgi:hypothetical protein
MDSQVDRFVTPRPRRALSDRRLYYRFIPRSPLTGQIEPAESDSVLFVQVQDLSARGIGLVCLQACAPGTEVCLRMLNPSATAYLIVKLFVVRCEPALAGGHYLGCEFARKLEPGELRPFLV